MHAIAPDGTGDRVILAAAGGAFPAAPDPRGELALAISVAETPEGHREQLWQVPLAGGAPTALTPSAEFVRNPAWSADGGWLAFETNAASFRDVFRIARGGGMPTRLTTSPNGTFEPAIARDGTLAFGSSRDGNAEIYRMNVDGSGLVRLTDHPLDDVHPGWRPDGKALAWLSSRDGAPRVWLVDFATPSGAQRPLRPAAAGEQDADFAWSPDGRVLAVVVQSGPKNLDIDLVDAATGARIARIGGPNIEENPAWSPDGRALAYTASHDGESDLHVVNADGSGDHAITNVTGAQWLPRWVPAPR